MNWHDPASRESILDVHLTIDFYDDLIQAQGKWDEAALRQTVRELAQRNISTIHWIDHGRFNTGLFDNGAYLDGGRLAQELARKVPDPLAVICDEAHKVGLKVIAVIKPWDMGFGSPYDSAPFSHASADVRCAMSAAWAVPRDLFARTRTCACVCIRRFCPAKKRCACPSRRCASGTKVAICRRCRRFRCGFRPTTKTMSSTPGR